MYRLTRRLQLIWRRIIFGFPEQDLWELYVSLAKWILPRLRRFKQIQHGYPIILNDDEQYNNADNDNGIYEQRWDDILDKMILAFRLIAEDEHEDDGGQVRSEVEEGLDLFREQFFSLWD